MICLNNLSINKKKNYKNHIFTEDIWINCHRSIKNKYIKHWQFYILEFLTSNMVYLEKISYILDKTNLQTIMNVNDCDFFISLYYVMSIVL